MDLVRSVLCLWLLSVVVKSERLWCASSVDQFERTILYLRAPPGARRADVESIDGPAHEFKLKPLTGDSDRLAAHELRRYIYLTTNAMAVLSPLDSVESWLQCLEQLNGQEIGADREFLVVGQHDGELIRSLLGSETLFAQPRDELSLLLRGLEEQSFLLAHLTLRSNSRVHVVVATGNAVGALYAAYDVCERLGVGFRLHGDSLPDRTLPLPMESLAHKHLFTHPNFIKADGLVQTPAFAFRGLQPFHDFPEGPDWWNQDTYKAVMGQVSKMKMNFIGLHTYPYSSVLGPSGTNEPTTWIGVKDDVNPDGTVTLSYPTAYANTMRGEWGYQPMATSDYSWGSAQLFDTDCFGVDVNVPYCPYPTTMTDNNAFFQATAEMLNNAFEYGHSVGVQSCLGTETPLTPPPAPNGTQPTTQDWYEGIFTRLLYTMPELDMYWIWTPEDWEWGQLNSSNPEFTDAIQDLEAAMAAHDALSAPFVLATNGWVVGPLPDRSIFDKVLPTSFAAIASIDMDLGMDPVDPSYQNITRHPKWVIPWMEDDPALTAVEIWVNRTLEHMEDALNYGCVGLLGIHWRTRVTSMTIAAMAQRSWDWGLTSAQFWQAWVQLEFGVADALAGTIAAVFESIDSFNMPRPASWQGGPGGWFPSTSQCGLDHTAYGFIEELELLQPLISGAVNQDRYLYWLENFRYTRDIARFDCAWALYSDALGTAQSGSTPSEQRELAWQFALPAYQQLVDNATLAVGHLQQTLSTTGELGTYMNVESHNLINALSPDALIALLGENLPLTALKPTLYSRVLPVRIIVPTVLSSVASNSSLTVRVLVLAHQPCLADSVVAYFGPLGAQFESFSTLPASQVVWNRSVYTVTFPLMSGDFEYYLSANCSEEPTVLWPVGAPLVTQSVILY